MNTVFITVHLFQIERSGSFLTCNNQHFSTVNLGNLYIFEIVSQFVRIVYTDIVLSFFKRLINTILFYSRFCHLKDKLRAFTFSHTQDSIFSDSLVSNLYRQVSCDIQICERNQCICIGREACMIVTVFIHIGNRSQLNRFSKSLVLIIEIFYFQCNYTVFHAYNPVSTPIIQAFCTFLVTDNRCIVIDCRLWYDPFCSRHMCEIHDIPFCRSNLCQCLSIQIQHQTGTVSLLVVRIYDIDEIHTSRNGILVSNLKS